MNKKLAAVGLVGILIAVLAASSLLLGAASASSTQQDLRQANPFTSSGPAGAPGHHAGGQSFRVTQQETSSTNVDVGSPGDTPGDFFVFASRLFNQDQVRVGRDTGKCTANSTAGTTIKSLTCEVAFKFNGQGGIRRGRIEAEGFVRITGNTPSNNVPITGGTGHYKDVRGQVHPRQTITFDLIQ
jgi:hypothetical protein